MTGTDAAGAGATPQGSAGRGATPRGAMPPGAAGAGVTPQRAAGARVTPPGGAGRGAMPRGLAGRGATPLGAVGAGAMPPGATAQPLVRSAFAGEVVDLLVIGGGITGAALAYEAASRGLSTALVERGDFGGATSAATGKLIHGGLRYLKKLEVGLVRESLAERRNLMRIAPNLVSPVPIVLPHPGLVEHAGLTAYDLLAFDRNRLSDPSKRIPRHRPLSRAQLDAYGLEDLRTGLLYYDAMMLSPERLTLAFLRSAVAAGAQVANYTRAERLLVQSGRVAGAELLDVATGEAGMVRARVTVNATGSWAHDLLAATPATAALAGPPPRVRSEGIYLVTRKLSDVMV
ncbi:MAG: FAD-dependent oxidoreductase, partial [Bifidobacteriaceae bacterium]|nr:FAD-dependent oxidoreductase [Bifidobacteriaceae bacterium]